MGTRRPVGFVSIVGLVVAVLTLSISCATGPDQETDGRALDESAARVASEDTPATAGSETGGRTVTEGSLVTLVGVWEGTLELPGASLDLVVRFLTEPGVKDTSTPQNPVATMDIPAQMAYRLPLSRVTVSGSRDGAPVHFELQTGGAPLVFDGTLVRVAGEAPIIAGDFVQGPAAGTIEITRTGDLAVADKSDAQGETAGGIERAVSVESKDLVIHGTFRRAEGVPGDGPAPLVILVAGSGPTDRDGNSAMLPGRNDSLKQLAEALGERGIASLRYDKRGVGASTAPGLREEDQRFSDLINDLLRWIAWATEEPAVSRIYLAGHSEGGLVVLASMGQSGDADQLRNLGIDPQLAAAAREAVHGIVTIAAPGRRFDELTLSQLARSLGETSTLYATAQQIFDALESGTAVPQAPQELAALFRPSVYPYLRSIIQFDPVALVHEVSQPVLVAAGDQDIQVPVNDAELLASAADSAELLVVEGMNHVLKLVPAGEMQRNQQSYYDPSFELSVGLVDGIASFVNDSDR